MDLKKTFPGVRILEANLKLVADHPFKIDAAFGMASVAVSVEPDQRDFAKLIGSRGAIYNAFRVIAAAIGRKHQVTFTLASLVESHSQPATAQPLSIKGGFIPSPTWPREEIKGTLEPTVRAMLGDDTVLNDVDHPASHKTIFEVLTTKGTHEPMDLAAISMALNKVYDAAGRKRGRILEIVVSEMFQKSHQPSTSDGRFARMKRPA